MKIDRDAKLIAEAYQRIFEAEGQTLESILPSLAFQQTTKKALQYKFVNTADINQLPPVSYTVAKAETPVETITADGKETQNVAQPQDVIISGPSKEKYVIKSAKFPKLYTGTLGQTVTPEQSPRTVAQVTNISAPLTFKAPWGEDMILKPGDYLVKDGDQGYYRIAKAEYEATYNPLKTQAVG